MVNRWGSPIWLLATPRSGSTWLSYLLNRAVGLPYNVRGNPHTHLNRVIFDEHYHEDGIPVLGPIVAKVHIHQAELTGIFRDPPRGLRLVRLTRLNRAEQIASMICSQKRRLHHAKDDRELESIRSLPVDFTSKDVLSCNQQLIAWNHHMDNYCHRFPTISVCYESLLQDPITEVQRLLDGLGVNVRVDIPDDLPLFRLGSPPEMVAEVNEYLLASDAREAN